MAPGRLLTLWVYLSSAYFCIQVWTLHSESTPWTGACADHKEEWTKMPLTLHEAILVRSDYILHIFNPCGDVTILYLLWQLAKVLKFK